jgi:hypothetical protein
MHFRPTRGAGSRRTAEKNSARKSSQQAACSKSGFTPGNGDGMGHLPRTDAIADPRAAIAPGGFEETIGHHGS